MGFPQMLLKYTMCTNCPYDSGVALYKSSFEL